MSPEKNSATPISVPSSERHSGANPGAVADDAAPATRQREIGGPSGPEPTRFGDWERNGRCIDF
ncbi:MAG: succinate dehydrogenase assembly factor 4 [Steroidobacteraceae bacterium]